jgi:hypothetical protein
VATTSLASSPARATVNPVGQVAPPAQDRSSMLRLAGIATVLMLALIPVQIAIYLIWPPPTGESASEWFRVFQDNWLHGLVSLDLLYLLTNVLLIPMYLGLFIALRRVNPALMLFGLVVGLVGLAAYFSSNTGFEMLALSNSHAAAATEAERAAFVAAGEAMLATYTGTTFDVYYIFNAVALLVFAIVMLRTEIFSNTTAYAGFLAAALMAIPSTAGVIGMIFAFASLIPWALFSVLVARRLFQLAQTSSLVEGEER